MPAVKSRPVVKAGRSPRATTIKASVAKAAAAAKLGSNVTILPELITPEMAHDWYTMLNAKTNRNIRKRKVKQYARDMLAGRWVENGQTIKFDINDRLVDGQHRLLAIVEAGIPVMMLVARGLPPEAIDTIDTGMARTFADLLRFDGQGDSAVSGTVVRRIWLWKQGYRTALSGGATISTSHSELMAYYKKYKGEIRMAVARGNDVRAQTGLLTTSTGAMAFYLFAEIEYDQAQQFFDMLITGDGIQTGHPVHTLRKRLMKALKVERLTEIERLALVVKAWNAYRNDEVITSIAVHTGKKLSNDNFPVPV